MRSHGVAGWVALLALTGCLACSEPGANPRFEASAVFAEEPTEGLEERVVEGDAPSEESSLKARLRQRRAQQLQGPLGGEGPASSLGFVQSVSLASRLQADLPLRSDHWSWAEEQGATLILHSTAGGPPDALIYAEAFSRLSRNRPAAEVRRFLLSVVPELPTARLRTLRNLDAQILPVVDELPRTHGEMVRAVEKILTSTLGRGVGFIPESDGFSGWKWLGRNQQGAVLRVGRVEGRWGAQPDLDRETRTVLEDLAQEVPELEDLLWDDPDLEIPSHSPAHLVLASVSLGNGWGQGVHVAILCRRAPRCPVEADLVRFLDGLRWPEPGVSSLAAGPTSSLETLAARAGLQLSPANESRRRAVRTALERLAPGESEPHETDL